MTLFLASVRDAAEAETALGAGADIIDLKDPVKGALGAVDADIARDCLSRISGRAKVSATIGDVPMHPDLVRDAVLATARLGVDYVKFGIFPGGEAALSLALLASETRSVRLIVLLFADAMPGFDAIEASARIGAQGVMLDTAGKSSGSLLDHMDACALKDFVAAAKANGLLAGLAGSLKPEQVPELLALDPDLLGFRGALCQGGARLGVVDAIACARIRSLIPRSVRAPSKLEPYLHPQALC